MAGVFSWRFWMNYKLASLVDYFILVNSPSALFLSFFPLKSLTF